MKDRPTADRLNQMWNYISTLTVKQRKRIILLCRAQEIVIGDPYNLLCIQTSLIALPSELPDQSEKRFYDFILANQDFIRSPTLSSILLDICRSAPLSTTEIKNAKLASWGKEISICESPNRPPKFNYRCWFYPEFHNEPLIAGTPPNYRMASRIHLALINWRTRLQRKVLYPRISNKMMSHDTRREYERITGRKWEYREEEGGVEFTQAALERLYHDTGMEVDGPCEIRQKWYPSGITPRTYFASGGTAFNNSKYIQEIASDLTAQLETTHPITRLNPARIRLKDPSRYLRIYDLSGFTSNHWECKYFVDDLIKWCSGYDVMTVDAVAGLVPRDLGDLLSEYNQQMNRQPMYSLEKLGSDYDGVMEYHNRAGFLGVYGNINFSTFVHGCSLLMVVEDTDEANVAGDDAHYSETPGHEYIADRIIDANGFLEPTKTFRSDQIGAVCLKRGLIQHQTYILPKVMLVFPSLANLGSLFGYRPPQHAPKNKSGLQKLSTVGTELYRFLRGVYLAGIDNDLDVVSDLLQAIYQSAHLPTEGRLPPYGEILLPVCPKSPSDFLHTSPLISLMHYHFDDGIALPTYLRSGENDGSEDPILMSGGTWVGTSTKKLRYLEMLGYVTKEKKTEVFWGIQAYNRVLDIFCNTERDLYEYSCFADVPYELASLPN